MGDLRFLINGTTPIYAISTTLPHAVLKDISKTLRLRPDNTVYLQRSNDRPDISLMVWELSFPTYTFRDLDFLIPHVPEGYNGDGNDLPIEKFVVFFDDTKAVQGATYHLQTLLPESLKHKIRWFHSTMTSDYCQEHTNLLRNTEIWGLCMTDAFGMVRILITSSLRFNLMTRRTGNGLA